VWQGSPGLFKHERAPAKHELFCPHGLVLPIVFLAQINQPFGDGEFGQSRDAMDIQLLHDPLAVRFHRANAHPEGVGDFRSESLPSCHPEIDEGPPQRAACIGRYFADPHQFEGRFRFVWKS
jgi:hypothetical protein